MTPQPTAGAAQGVVIKVGDRIKDNDPRMERRAPLTVVRIWEPLAGLEGKAVCQIRPGVGQEYPILLRRIYADGKPRKSGFTLLPATDTTEQPLGLVEA